MVLLVEFIPYAVLLVGLAALAVGLLLASRARRHGGDANGLPPFATGVEIRDFLETSSYGVGVQDENGIVRYVNERLCRMWEAPRDEIIGRPAADFLSEESLASDREAFERRKAGDQTPYEVVFRSRGGRRVHAITAPRPIFDREGRFRGTLGIVTDITEVRRTEDALCRERDFSAAVLDTVGALVVVLDRNGAIVRFNRASEETMGYSEDEVRGRALWDFILTEEEIEPVKRVFASLAAGRFPNAHENDWIAKGGALRRIAWSNTALTGEGGEVEYVIGTGIDITERRRLEEELFKIRKLESLGVLAGGIAHDFNNQLAAIAGRVAVAKLSVRPDDEVAAHLDVAEQAIERAKALPRQLLTFAKGGAPVKRIVPIAPLVRDAAGFALTGVRSRCDIRLPDDLWPVEIDEGQIAQVIQNLLVNAEQAMPEGGTISISAANVALPDASGFPLASGRYVRVEVADEGVGIDPEDIPRVFDPFFTTKTEGSGLGLAIAYSVIRKHGGHIAVESAVGAGTKILFWLPVASRAQDPSGAGAGAASPDYAREAILLMDDDSNVREVSGKLIAHLGYTVELARDGAEAIEMYERARADGRAFAAVLLDLVIEGGMGGEETIRRILAIDPSARVIVTSGYSSDLILADHRAHGVCAVLEKPYRIEQLRDVLRRVIAGEAKARP
ncbi:MAG: PAS domain S-box protein [Planctomycetes bacterium]|nr:PAS domain S-box protein [Planctomycetota bacterium]